ncbi:MAG: diaminopropionate ammonia-lyase [Lutibacter sp.]|jgi:diaminopropionate ammonia-lyase
MISIIDNKSTNQSPNSLLNKFDESIAAKARTFHSTFPYYKPTPLVELHGLANLLGVKNIWLKDESYRFDLNAFKVLGASYAIADILHEKLNLHNSELSFALFKDESIRRKIKNETLITATDGNHGRGVAWTARQLGCNCVVYMPKGTTLSRYQNIKLLRAEVILVDGNYDAASERARSEAEKNKWLLVQDSSWDGYEKIPLLIMQGYLTIMNEVFDQLKDEEPTHVFVQCGVGSLPAAVLAYLKNRFGTAAPLFSVVEPENSACVYESFVSGDGNIRSVKNEANTIMAGLAFQTPSKLAWEIMRDHADYFIKCEDSITIDGMKILGRRQFGDDRIISGESGAVTLGLIFNLLSDSSNNKFAEQLHLNSESKIFLISTEGDTDPEMYQKILSQ